MSERTWRKFLRELGAEKEPTLFNPAQYVALEERVVSVGYRKPTKHALWYWATRDYPYPKEQMFTDRLAAAWLVWHWARGLDPYAPRRGGRYLPQALRRAVIERDGYVCGLCGDGVPPADVHIDHVLPVFHGGKDTLANLQVAHSFCNMSKGARLVVAGAT